MYTALISRYSFHDVGRMKMGSGAVDEVVWRESDEATSDDVVEMNYLQVSLADINLATQDFSHDNLIGEGGFGRVYRGKLLCAGGHNIIAAKRLNKMSDQGETELNTELVILSEYKHMNVIDLVSYCNENGEKVIVYDYAARGSLDKWLKHKELTWRKRLEICIDIARGLEFLHGTSDVKQVVVIHRDIKSANILLHDDWKASIADFGLSLISPINQDIKYVIDNVKGTRGYCDPLYMTTKTLTKESDIYSLGVLLFEMLCGRFVMEHNNSRAQDLVHLVRHHFKEGTLYEMVFAATKKQMAPNSLTAFRNIAYQCIHEERSKRPTAYDVLIQLEKALEHQEKWENLLNISLDNILLATQDFTRDNLIEKGDFWSVYKGQLTWADGCEMIIAVKRLDRRSDQRQTEHMAELEILLEYTHENVVSLVGYCNEKEENIMVYDYASISKGSLDRWLKYDGLTWRKRLEICIDIARGLVFLHGTSGAKQEVVIHGDIKSSNVLLHGDWKAKIAYFGCSLIRPINREMKYVVNNAKGTPGYCDPLNTTTGVLTKESDIYSFGVLLFEMLCGRFVMEYNSSRAQNLVHLVRDHFEEGTLYEIVFEATKRQLAPKSLTTFLNIAYQCLHDDRSKRPTANDVLIQLKMSLELQVIKDLRSESVRLSEELGVLREVARSPQDSRKALSEEMDRLRPLVEKVEQLRQRCRNFEEEKPCCQLRLAFVEAFYKGEFPYVSMLVEKAGWSLDELVALEPPAYQEAAPSPPVSLV
ncbi:kinase-like domain, phloem protein 2-like protein [Tanacetum coccineum]